MYSGVTAAFAALALILAQQQGLRLRYAALIAMLWFAWGTFRLLPTQRRQLFFWAGIGLAAVVLATVFSIELTVAANARHPSAWEIQTFVFPALVAWASVVWVAGDPNEPAPWEPPSWAPWGIASVAAAALTRVHLSMLGRYRLGVDETVYAEQAGWFGHPGFGRKIPLDLLDHFSQGITFLNGDIQIGQYPPGWPALIHLADLLHARFLLIPIFTAIALVCTYRLGKRLHSAAAGLIAMALLASQHWFLEFQSTLLSHASNSAALLGAAWLLVDHDDPRRLPSPARTAAAGALIGVAVTIRPVSGVLIGLSLGLWLWLRADAGWMDKVTRIGWAALGALPLGLALLAYNQATTGAAFRLGYTAARGDLHNLGFGIRGPSAFNFTPQRAGEFFATLARETLLKAVSSGFLLPLAWLGVAKGARARWGAVGAFLILPAVQFFYFANRVRVNFELLPFLLVGVAVLVVVAGRQVLPVLALAIAGNFWFAAPWPATELQRPAPEFVQTLEDLGARARGGERLLIFFDDGGAWAPRWVSVRILNLDGAIVVRSLGPSDSLVVQRFPTYTPLRLKYVGEHQPGLVTAFP